MSFNSKLAISARGLGKSYTIYSQPLDRLRQIFSRGNKRFGHDFTALSDVSFDLFRGQVLGIVGNNGAGKSTLLQLICGTVKATSGELVVNGRIAALLELGAGFNPEFTGRENIFLNAAILGLTTEETVSRFDEIVEFSGIRDFIDQPVKTYSSGMYVRLAFSIATSVEPDILVIDEALSVGDGLFARKSFDRIMALRDAGATILFCSHSMYHIEAICDRALWLERGKVRMIDTPSLVTRAYSDQLLPSLCPVQTPEEKPASANDSTSGDVAGQARLLEVKVSSDGKPGPFLQLQAGRSSLRIEVRFQFDPALPTPSVAFGLETEAGLLVSSGGSVFDRVAPTLLTPGFGGISLEFPKISLMRGRYRLTVFLGCERALHVYDHAQYCAVLDVEQEGNEQGFVFLPRVWNDDSSMQD